MKTKVESQQALARATPSIWPLVGWLSSGFGKRRDPFTGAPDFHPGLDIAADRGTPVRATADGTVESAGYNGNYGNSVVIDHGFGIATRFGHLSRLRRAAPASRSSAATSSATSAPPAAPPAPHLHYEILLNGQPINPLRLLGQALESPLRRAHLAAARSTSALRRSRRPASS